MLIFRKFFQGADGDLRQVGRNNGNYAYYCQPVYDGKEKCLYLYYTDTCELRSDEEREDVYAYHNIGMRGVRKVLKRLAREEQAEYEYQAHTYKN